MSLLPHHRLRLLLLALLAGLGAWMFLPGTALDRLAFTCVARGFFNPPIFVTGEGKHTSPWKLGSMAAQAKPDQRQAPMVVSLDDDIEGFFQSTPPAPIDLAVVFSNFFRLGARKAASAMVLAWESPDPIGLVALEQSLGKFDSLVMAAPLTRAVVSSPLPTAFRQASLPLSSVHGDINRLPIVNRIPLPGIILGGNNALAGFSYLESEPTTKAPSLLARWHDRLIFSFPLLTVMQRANLPLDGMEIHLGKYLKLSLTGPIIPLDDAGRLDMPVRPIVPYKEISAEALIDGGDELFPKEAPDPVILRDDRSALDASGRAFSASLSGMIAALASNEAYAQTSRYPRPPPMGELAIITLSLLAMAWAQRLGGISVLVMACTIVALQFIGMGLASLWLPGLPALAAIFVLASTTLLPKKTLAPITDPAQEPVLPPQAQTAIAEPLSPIASTPTEASKKTTRSPRTKKDSPPETPAKKTAPRKTAAKKAASPRKPRTKKPPANS